MRAANILMLVGSLLSALVDAQKVSAQDSQSQVQATEQFTPEQLDQMLAPIALYPDVLVGQILMAATYPLQVVEADRWLQEPSNAALAGDPMTAALEQQNWDPSVKSLAPFPQILHMMDGNLDWTQRLGEAFLADQAAVMDSVQRLRQRAQTAGQLQSTPEQKVGTDGQAITIEPPMPETVYVQVYNPSVAYGPWPYPERPPYYFPDAFGGLGWLSVVVVEPLRGWHHCDWDHHRIDIDRDRWRRLDHGRSPALGPGGEWRHDPAHDHDFLSRDPDLRVRFPGMMGGFDGRHDLRAPPTPSAPLPRPYIGGERPRAMPQSTPSPVVQHTQPPRYVPAGRVPETRIPMDRGQPSHIAVPAVHPTMPTTAQPASGGAR